jgi:transcriptional regulator with XRE-family HTH domain
MRISFVRRIKYAVERVLRQRIRLREGMTKAELARQLGTHPTVIQLWLNGTAIGRKASVKRIEAFLEDQPKRSDRARNA